MIWYNRDIRIGGHSIYNNSLFSIGIWYVNDLFKDNNLIPFHVWKTRGALEKDYLTWLAICKIVKNNIIQVNESSGPPQCGVEVDGKLIEINDLTQKHIKQCLLKMKYSCLLESDFKFKIKACKYYGNLTDEDWECIFMLPRSLPVDNKLKELQYKILMRYVPTNYLLNKMKIVNSQTCTFCNLYPETIDHVFYHCTEVKDLWLYVLAKWQSVTHKSDTVALKHFILGIYNNLSDKFTKSLNIVILLFKYYVMNCRYEQVTLSTIGFECMCKSTVQMYKIIHNDEAVCILNDMFAEGIA